MPAGAAGFRSGRCHRCGRGRRGALRSALLLLGPLLVGLGQPAAAQTQPGSFEDYIGEQSAVIERFSPPPEGGTVTVRVRSPDAQVPAMPEEPVALSRVALEGVSHLDPAVLETLWSDLLGQAIAEPLLAELTDRIDRFYRAQGILARSYIPAQEFAAGTVRVVVDDDSHIGQVTVTGDAARLVPRLEPYIRRLRALRPLRLRELERVLLLVSDISGMDITALLQRPDRLGQGGPLSLDLDFRPVQARLSLDSFGSEDIGPLILVGSVQGNDLLGAFEGSALTAVTVPNATRELRFVSAAQEVPIGEDGLGLGYQIALARSDPGGDARQLGLSVQSQEGAVYASFPFVRTIIHNVTGTIALNAQDSSVAIGGATVARDEYRWASIEGSTDYDLGIAGVSLDLQFRQGLGIFGATGEGDPMATQPGATPDFRSMQVAAELFVNLSRAIRVAAYGAGQYAFSDLPAMVEMRYGGDPVGRAFGSAAILGDTGLAGLLEISHRLDFGTPYLRQTAVIGFIDYGLLHSRGDQARDSSHALSSGGIGLSGTLAGGFQTELFLAVPLKTDASIDDQGTRLVFAVRKQF